MPDAAGNIKGSGYRAKQAAGWERVFGQPPKPEPTPHRGWPSQSRSKASGCTCDWWGGGSIARFSDDCPILEQHRR